MAFNAVGKCSAEKHLLIMYTMLLENRLKRRARMFQNALLRGGKANKL